jgi:site-specific DNA-cytosine methylase
MDKIYPTVTSVMWHPTPELRKRWLKQYGKDRFTFEEALYAQTFPSNWLFPESKTKKWKWLAEAFPPKVALYLFNKINENNLVLLDLFSGIGGWSLGAVWSNKFRKIIMVEKDREKCTYLRINFEKLKIDFEIICRDVREIDTIKADVITASPPCEDLTILRYFSKNNINKGTIPLTIWTINYVNEAKPKIAFYENVYSKTLADILRKHGWIVEKFNMEKIIPQKRIRLIGYWYRRNQQDLNL